MANTLWLEFLAATGARITGTIAAFGDSAEESGTARDGTILAPLIHLAQAGFGGDDAQTWLHNLLTSDVKSLEPGAAQHSAWCSPKGRMLASFILYRDNFQTDAYRALLSADLIETTLKRLQMYILRSKVKLSDESSSPLLGIAGSGAADALRFAALPVPEKGAAAFDEGTVIRLDARRFILAAKPESTASISLSLWKKLAEKATPVGNLAWQWLDIQAGIPLITEATQEKFVPQMVGLEKIDGVSFKKGCYPGQEVVARSQYLGQLKRHLYRLHADAPLNPGDAIHTQNQELPCGTIALAAPAPEGGFDALAVIQDAPAKSGQIHLDKTGASFTAISTVYPS